MSLVSKGSTVSAPPLVAAAHRLAESGELRSGILAIDGPSGSGKSTFADALIARLGQLGRPALLIRTDDFATWDDPASWWPELEADVLAPFGRSHDVIYRPRIWSHGTARPGPEQHLRWAPLMVLEGVTSARQAIAGRLARALWIESSGAQQRLDRAVARDGEDQRELLAAWQRFEEGWFAVDRTPERCEILR